ncbi:TIGR02302 family protein [Pleomorphomonas sp. JP5]|uniref:TIGR02302 family protein n=1 Tax=Pleomorphomonas sp. JP5 TaxID=2942998 RepID=UPI002044C774|nr:TIGR02302 family protein [Pleomorphomonas sp. JP5]MCM5556653.1 TIGR02302 family protein [Pleomorphomonas sp. JP5]
MTEGPHRPNDREGDLPPATARAIGLAGLSLAWERLWPRLALTLSLLGAFLALAWLGAFERLPTALRLSAAGLFVAAFLASLVPLLRTPWPDRRQAADRLERGVPHRPLSAFLDHPSTTGDRLSDALWQAHRRRLAASLEGLRADRPSPRLDRADPYAIRSAVFLLVIVGFFATPDHLGSVANVFRLPIAAPSDIRVNVWANPPTYTGQSPRALVTTANGAVVPPENSSVTLPAGTTLVARLAGVGAPTVTFARKGQPPMPLEGRFPAQGQTAYEYRLASSGTLSLAGDGLPALDLPIAVRSDAPPTIRLIEQPAATSRGALRLAYSVTDDYRVAAARAILSVDADEGARPLAALPDVTLGLPRRGEDRAVATSDLTGHPLAGSRVHLVLEARDDAGQVSETPPLVIDLPSRPFRNPLAAAIVEQRRLLAADARQAKTVASTFETMGDLGAAFIDRPGEIIGLRVARNRILHARDDAELKPVLDYLWQMALAIEAGDSSPAAERLAAAREALKSALENGASPEEIARLTEELKAALDEYIKAMAQAAAANPSRLGDLGQKGGERVTSEDLKKLIDRMRELGELGERDAAAQLLSQLDDILSGLQFATPKAGGSSDPTLDELADIIRRQQELQNRTHKLTPDGYTGEEFGDDSGDQRALEDLGREQSALSRRLGELMSRLSKDTQSGMDGLEGAGRAMRDAGRDLGSGDADSAVGNQGAALDALRRGAREMMRGQEQGTAGVRDGGTDPLGRPTGRRGPDFGDGTKVPGEIEVQRARRLLEELRRRYADPDRPPLELDYLRRLIAPF